MKKTKIRVCVALLGLLLGTTSAMSFSRVASADDTVGTGTPVVVNDTACAPRDDGLGNLIIYCAAKYPPDHRAECLSCCENTFGGTSTNGQNCINYSCPSPL